MPEGAAGEGGASGTDEAAAQGDRGVCISWQLGGLE